MKKNNFLSGLAIAALAMGGLFLSHKADKEEQLSSALMANVEALTSSESSDRAYAYRNEKTVEIWDDPQNIHQSITVIECEGKGNIACP